jgi:hypothetical protein
MYREAISPARSRHDPFVPARRHSYSTHSEGDSMPGETRVRATHPMAVTGSLEFGAAHAGMAGYAVCEYRLGRAALTWYGGAERFLRRLREVVLAHGALQLPLDMKRESA